MDMVKCSGTMVATTKVSGSTEYSTERESYTFLNKESNKEFSKTMY
jgi:hypothetical protein